MAPHFHNYECSSPTREGTCRVSMEGGVKCIQSISHLPHRPGGIGVIPIEDSSAAGTERNLVRDLRNHRLSHTCSGLCRPTDLQREDDIDHELLSAEAVIWHITTVVYGGSLKAVTVGKSERLFDR